MRQKSVWIWAILVMFLMAGMALTVACGDDDDDDDTVDDDDTEDDDDAADDDDATDDDDAADDDDVADDDDTADDDDDATGDYEFNWETVEGIAPIGNAAFYGQVQGHDILAAMAIVALNGLKQDAVEWDMVDGVPAGSYDFEILEGEDLGQDDNPSILVVFGLSIDQSYTAAYVGVSGTCQIDATGVVGDTFTGAATDVTLRPIDLTSGAVDWDSGKKGFIGTFAVDTTIQKLPGS